MLSPSISIVLKDTVFDETEGSYSMRILVPISSPRRQISFVHGFTRQPRRRLELWADSTLQNIPFKGTIRTIAKWTGVTVSQIEGIKPRFNPDGPVATSLALLQRIDEML